MGKSKNPIRHFKDISIVTANMRVDIPLSKYDERFALAQEMLGNNVLHGCRAVMPLSTGNMQQRSHTDEDPKHLRDESRVENGGRQVVFPGPYARFQYGGEVMVDPDTGSPWARKGVKKVFAGRPLTYSNPEATDHWFDEAKARNLDSWISGVADIIGGKMP